MPERPGPVVDALPSARPALDLSSAVRSRVRESLVREGVRANLLAEVTPSEAAIVDAVARGAEVVRSHRRDIDALRQAAAGLLSVQPAAPAEDRRDRAVGKPPNRAEIRLSGGPPRGRAGW